MPVHLKPTPAGAERVKRAKEIRNRATDIVEKQAKLPIEQMNNGESKLDPPIATFTKSLPHNDFGIVDKEAYKDFVTALNEGFSKTSSTEAAAFDVELHSPTPDLDAPYPYKLGLPAGAERTSRAFESPLAGHTYVLQGPDPDAVAMPPAPKLGSHELTAEMADVYAMALLRDVPFNEIDGRVSGKYLDDVQTVINSLNKLAWFNGKVDEVYNIDDQLDKRAKARRQARFTEANENKVTQENIFRGSSFGCKVGPYISQFLLIGNPSRPTRPILPIPEETPEDSPDGDAVPLAAFDAEAFFLTSSFDLLESSDPATLSGIVATGGLVSLSRRNDLDDQQETAEERDGFIQYGAQLINQRIVPHLPGVDYMTDWNSWLDVQNGADRREIDQYRNSARTDPMENLPALGRFIHTPRDLATFVHFDALYQAYLNACLLLISRKANTDAGLPESSQTRAGFATFGDPHVLTLVTETATRALKAVRRQKYQIHLRARPEAIGGALTVAHHTEHASKLGTSDTVMDLLSMCKALKHSGLADMIAAHNSENNEKDDNSGAPETWVKEDKNLLLPMAFPEGSPVHASYGAGHATVAGSCTTILKAFFEMYEGLEKGSEELEKLNLDKLNVHQLDKLFGARKKLVDSKDSLVQVHYRTGTLVVNKPQDGENFEGGALEPEDDALTIEGELNKLAANISIGRDFAGVHYYTDYYESLRMGERIAVQILQEHMLTYDEAVFMRFTSFDGDRILITGKGDDDKATSSTGAGLHIWSQNDAGTWVSVSVEAWWNRALNQTGQAGNRP